MKASEIKSSNTNLFIPNYDPKLSKNSVAQGFITNQVAEIPEPQPVIQGFTNDGIISIKFNTPMVVPDV